MITGGAGGAGGYGGGGGGAGGAAVYLANGGLFINRGQVAGGVGGAGWHMIGANGVTGAGIVISGSGTVDNFSTVSGGAYSVVITGAGGVLKVEAGSLLIGAAKGGGGTLELVSGSGAITSLGASGTISGSEAMSFSGFGSYQIDSGNAWNFVGTDAIASGTAFIDNGQASSTGALTIAGTISGAGALSISGGTAAIGPGAVVTVANLTLGSGFTTLNESLTYLGAFIEAAPATLTLGNNDQLVLSGPTHLSGAIGGGGTVIVANATVGGFSIGGTDVLIDTGVVTQTGAMHIDGGLVISKSATWTILGQIDITHGPLSPYLTVAGTFIGSCAAGPSSILATTTDNGTIDAAVGTLIFTSALTGSGVLKIESGGTLQVGSSVASTLTTTFAGAAATLALRRTTLVAHSFAATIAGFAIGDAIDLLNTSATGASVNGADQLVVVNGAKTVATLQLTGAYAGATFATTADGGGGTNVILASVPAAPSPHAFAAAMAVTGASAASSPVTTVSANATASTLLVPRGL